MFRATSDPISKAVQKTPQDNQLERVIFNHVGYPREKRYHNIIQVWLPEDKKDSGKGRVELFTLCHHPRI